MMTFIREMVMLMGKVQMKLRKMVMLMTKVML